jgi:polar amino acid transport system substrate-binding protein
MDYLRRFISLVVLAGTLTLALSGPATAQNAPVLDRVLQSGELRVGMSGNQPPLNFKNRAGQLRGLEVDLAAALAEFMNLELEVVLRPFPELLGALTNSEVDLVMSGMTITPERNLRVAFVGPYYLSGKSILTRSSSLAQVDEAGDLNEADLKIAALEGSTSQRFVQTLLPKASLVTTSNYDEAVALLLGDQVNVLVADREVVLLTAMRHPSEGLATLREPLTVEPIGIAAPPGDPLLVNFLENTIGALEASGMLSILRARWLESDDWIAELP